MLTQSSTAVGDSVSLVVPSTGDAVALHRFTVEQYHRMIREGILDENDKVELVEGWIVNMSPVGPSHYAAVQKVCEALRAVMPSGWHLRPQGPITLETGEPEPDAAIARGGIESWIERHPGPGDIALAVEVSDTSLAFDREAKRHQYASAQIPEYWIVNLIDRQLEVCREPHLSATGAEYRRREVKSASETVDLVVDGKMVSQIAVEKLLP